MAEYKKTSTNRNEKKKLLGSPTVENAVSVYHYTSVEALYSILGKKTLRFTDIKCMNDSNEVRDWEGIIRRYINEVFDGTKKELALKQLKKACTHTHAFVFCMSTGNDELPLWNYYTKNNNNEGYNIEFDYSKLIRSIVDGNANTLKNCGITFGSVLYNDELKQAALKDRLKMYRAGKSKTSAITSNNHIFTINSNTGNFDIGSPAESLFFSKHKTFEFEHEIRIVIHMPETRFISMQNMQKNKIIQYKTLNGSLIPYMDLKFDPKCINGINIAPMLKSDIAESGLESFLSSVGIRHKDMKNGIRKSTIPVRY